MYGRGAASIADQIKTHDGQATREDIKEAQSIVDNFFNGFPNVKKWIDKTESDAREFGYVEDLWGRRRRLPDIQKEPFDVISKTASSDFNPLLFSDTTYAPDSVNRVKYYKDKLLKTRSRREVDKIKEEAAKESIEIHDNGGYISQAQRQCVNARVQGGAASMSKVAMKLVYNDPELRRMGFRLCIAVHDELIGECPEEYGEAVQKRLAELMIEAGKPQCIVPMKCDTTTFKRWYEDEYAGAINKEYSDLIKKYTDEEALDIICKNHEECFPNELKAMLKN